MVFTSSESTSNFVFGDITISGGSLSSFAGSGTTYNATFTPSGQATYTINVAAGQFTDTAGNSNSASNNFIWIYDDMPTVSSFTMSDTYLEFDETATVTLVFSEAVSGFSSNDDITVQNGSLSTMTTSDNITWTGTFTATANTQDTENVLTLATSYTDTNGNTGPSATTANYIINNIFKYQKIYDSF